MGWVVRKQREMGLGVGFYHLTKDVRQMMQNVTKIDQDNYPETLYHTCIINAPTAFRAIWAIVKPMLNARTQAKVEVRCSSSTPLRCFGVLGMS